MDRRPRRDRARALEGLARPAPRAAGVGRAVAHLRGAVAALESVSAGTKDHASGASYRPRSVSRDTLESLAAFCSVALPRAGCTLAAPNDGRWCPGCPGEEAPCSTPP